MNDLLGIVFFLIATLVLMKGTQVSVRSVSTLYFWELGSSSVSLGFPVLVDKYSCIFLATVSVITASVLCFSSSYMKSEKFFLRFHLLIMFFVISMCLLILSPNMLSVMLGWDGLGVTSYLLVIYFQSPKSFAAGMLTVMTNRLGDMFLILGLSYYLFSGSWSLSASSALESLNLDYAVHLIFFVGCCTKSAQIPFSAWLPAAMAAPTPVSALVHSSTLVTAGVYLIFRYSHWFISWPEGLLLGSATMLMAGASALGEMDVKKIVALSTLSQLGAMFVSLSGGLTDLGFFHLLAHAYFKALLFISVGNLIHLAYDYQDLRKIAMSTPWTRVSLGVALGANLSLCGFPYLAGFYSKDLIIESGLILKMSGVSLFLFYAGAGLTLAYTLRLFYVLLSASVKSNSLSWLKDLDFQVFKGMILLWPLALMGSSLLMWYLNSPVHPPLCQEDKIYVWKVLGFSFFVTAGGLIRRVKMKNSGVTTWTSLMMLPLSFSLSFTRSSLLAGSFSRLSDLSYSSGLVSGLKASFLQCLKDPLFFSSNFSGVLSSLVLLGAMGFLFY